MAITVKEQRLIDNNKRALIKYVILSDGTTTSNASLVDVSSLRFALNTNGYIMTGGTDEKALYKTTVKRIFGQVSSNVGYIKLQWHINGSNTEIVTLGRGRIDYDFQSMGDGAVISNSDSANSTGDILYSTVNLLNNEAATIFVDLRKDSTDYDAGQTADPYAFNRVT